MNLSEIQELIKFVAKAGVTEVEIEQKDFKIVIKSDGFKKKGNKTGIQEHQLVQQQIPVAVPQVQAVATQPVVTNVQDPVVVSEQSSEKKEASPTDENGKYITVKSPMIGTFYRSSSPDKDPFINVDDSIKEGDVVCIIEAMKLFNEIESEVSGKIVKVLVEDSTPVEYDQPLFLVDPS